MRLVKVFSLRRSFCQSDGFDISGKDTVPRQTAEYERLDKVYCGWLEKLMVRLTWSGCLASALGLQFYKKIFLSRQPATIV
ncbi:hypothetical protein MRB53_026441 [Persea americana]|uniref:Uncharacterized protein n=1 Tax=Persea americana TaxID=3435 RepID=A0ACC2LI16_PERAE|nr:hypothetical protein MRB53_026441 [Persea americana]